jgi:hypothetical protein
MVNNSYFEVKKNGVSPFQNMICYLGGSTFQTIGDNPLTAYRQFIQQYATDKNGKYVHPSIATKEARNVFIQSPISASMSGLSTRLVGVLLKRVPKFGILLGYTTLTGNAGEPGIGAATAASVLSAPFINPVRMIEKQQRSHFRRTGSAKLVRDILIESSLKKYNPLFRGTIPLVGHSMASALLGLVGQPELQKKIQTYIGTKSKIGESGANLIASAAVTPFYVLLTNPLSRLEVIMQTSSIKDKRISTLEACKKIGQDMTANGMKGIFRGQGVGMMKGIVSLTLFHEGRLFLTRHFKEYNELHA